MRIPAGFVPAVILAALALGGCESFNQAIGLEKTIPDEFEVVSRAPLAIPPDYGLRPPQPGAAPTQEVSSTDQAKQTIFRAGGQDAALPGADQRSKGENVLLQEAGAADAAPHIRETITEEQKEDAGKVDNSFVNKLLFWEPNDKSGRTDTVIDPTLEAQQLKGGQAAATAQQTPTGLTGAPVIERARPPALTATF
jgi:hypothetical protein